jgi:NDP-sugar pyrophosphorylase family protein
MLPCLVLAGGIGSRMRPLTDSMPKALIPVAGEPFVDIQLRGLAAQGVREVVLSIGYRGELLREHVGDGGRHGLAVRYVDEQERRLGTGGAVRLAVDQAGLDDAFFVLYGDSYLSVDFAAVGTAWRDSGRPALMTVLRNENRWGPCNASYRSGMVTLYDKHNPTPQMRWIDYGLLVLTADTVREHIAADTVVDLSAMLHALSVEGRLAGLPVTRRFYEIGSPEGVRALETVLLRRRRAGVA